MVVLDLMLPGMDGMEVCRTLRDESEVPVVMLTARVEEEDRLAGGWTLARTTTSPNHSALGSWPPGCGQSCVVPPGTTYSRVQAELSYGDVKVDMRLRTVYAGENQVTLTPTEFRLLTMLIREPSRIFTREQIIGQGLRLRLRGFDRTVDAHVSNLRRKLGANSDGSGYIHTVYGVGYRFGNV